MLILVVLFVVCFTILAWKKIDWAILTLLFLLPTYLVRFSILGVPSTLLEIMILIVFIIWIIFNIRQILTGIKTNLKNRKIKSRYPFDIEMVLLLIISFVAVGVSGWSNSGFGIWKAYFLEPILLFLVMINVFQRKEDLIKISKALVLSGLAVSLFGIFQKVTGLFITNPFWANEATRRITSVFEYPNALGLYLAPLAILIIGCLINLISRVYKEKKEKINQEKRFLDYFQIILMIIIAILFLLNIYFAKTEAGLIAFLGGLIVFGLFLNKKTAIITILLTIVITIVSFSYQPAREFAIQKITLNDLSGQIRKLQWKETKIMLLDSRLTFGAGLNGYQAAVKPYHQEGLFYDFDNDPKFLIRTMTNEEYRKTHWQPVEIYLYPHNIILNFWTELGLAGMLLFVWLFVKCIYLGIKNYFNNSEVSKNFTLGITCTVLVIFIHGLVDVPYFKNDLAVMFWVLFAIMGLISIHNKRK